MGSHLEYNCLLVVPSQTLDLKGIKPGDKLQLVKDKERLYPLNIPIEMCDENHQYYGKVAVRKLTFEAGTTSLEIEVLKVFSADEVAVYTSNFLSPSKE